MNVDTMRSVDPSVGGSTADNADWENKAALCENGQFVHLRQDNTLACAECSRATFRSTYAYNNILGAPDRYKHYKCCINPDQDVCQAMKDAYISSCKQDGVCAAESSPTAEQLIQGLATQICASAADQAACAANFASLPDKIPTLMTQLGISDTSVVMGAIQTCAPGVMGDTSVLPFEPLGAGGPTCAALIQRLFCPNDDLGALCSSGAGGDAGGGDAGDGGDGGDAGDGCIEIILAAGAQL